MTSCPYERNTYLENSPTNLTIGELRRLSKADFFEWADKFRKEVTYAWDELGVPLIGGRTADHIVRDFKKLATYDVKKLERPDELNGKLDCIVNPNIGTTCKQFFPTMLKTKDISNGTLDGPSLYKYFAADEYADFFRREFRRQLNNRTLKLFNDADKRITDQVSDFRMSFPFRPAGNFPPITAKYLYLRFTEHLRDQDRVVIYDPCAGWGGRILGAMACCNERQVHYVGTDPNTDHWMPDLEMTKYAYLADYFNGNVRGRYKSTYEIFQTGSEEIYDDPAFQKYKGELDLVFTSPPYFAAEGYSDDETQAYNKFPTYEEWRDGFLRKTLETCVEYLKDGRWLIWNIADVGFSSYILPMESETIAILEGLGLEYRGKLKMALATPPGGNKETDDGVPTTKNFCRIDGKTRKFEPILMFWKPEAKQAEETKGWVPTFDELLETQAGTQDSLTPIEQHNRYWVKRDDLFEVAGVRGGKARTCWHLAQGATGLVTAGSRSSPQVNIVAHMAAELGIECRCHVPSGKLSPELEAAKEIGAEIIQHRPGYNSVIIARAREDAEQRNWHEIPFGMECEEAVKQTASQVKNLPDGIKRIVVPVGSGMSLAGVLQGLIDAEIDIPVLGVVVGADPRKRLNKYAPPSWEAMCELVESDVAYSQEVRVEFPVSLDPVYEAKCVQFMEDGDLLWIVGIRESVAG